jgi:hypothetical protein
VQSFAAEHLGHLVGVLGLQRCEAQAFGFDDYFAPVLGRRLSMPVLLQIALGILALQAATIVFCLSLSKAASLAERHQTKATKASS